MTLNIRGYDVTVIANLPDQDSYTATRMFLREFATILREAANENNRNGFKYVAVDYRREAYKIHEALDILEENH